LWGEEVAKGTNKREKQAEAAFEGDKWGDHPRPRSFDKKRPLSTNRKFFYE